MTAISGIVGYRCGFASEHKTYTAVVNGTTHVLKSKTELNALLKENEGADFEWSSDLTVEPISFVLHTVKRLLTHICDGAGTTNYIVFLSGSSNFRDKIATVHKYKGNRDNMRRPVRMPEIQEYLLERHPTIREDTLEADDLLADSSLALTSLGYDPIICTIDKDIMQVPGKYYSFVKGDKFNISPTTAWRKLAQQMLTGDSTDNIPGIYGVGPKTAEKLIAEVPSWEESWYIIDAQWHSYLSDESKRPDWVRDYNQEERLLTYQTYGGEIVKAKLWILLEELYKLLRIGEFDEPPPEEVAQRWIREHIALRIREDYQLPA